MVLDWNLIQRKQNSPSLATDRPGLYANISHPVSWKFYLPTNEVKNLGVTFDSGNTFASHITKVCHACYYHLKDFRCISKFLSVETAALLANSMISSRLLDYCNCLLYGVNNYNVSLLQKIRNTLYRIVFKYDKTSQVTSYLQNYIGSPFHTISCPNIILLYSRLSNSPNPNTYHP